MYVRVCLCVCNLRGIDSMQSRVSHAERDNSTLHKQYIAGWDVALKRPASLPRSLS